MPKTLLTVDKIRQVPDAYGISCGSFCVATLNDKNVSIFNVNDKNWAACRENFSKRWNQENAASHPFLMSVTSVNEQKENIAKFLRITEEKKLKLKKFSKVSGFTNDVNSILIEPAKWWSVNELRRQFLTILLRTGMYYYKNKNYHTSSHPAAILPEYKDYRKALYSSIYFAYSKEAVKKFLNGHTECPATFLPGGVYGWSWAFSNDQNLDKLTKPND